MTSLIKTHILKVGITTAMLIGLSFHSNADENKTEIDRTQIESIVREYLLANPEILLEVQEKLQEKQQAEMVASQKQYLQKNRVDITSSPYQIEIGSPLAKKTIIEFFDYNCHYCQKALRDMQVMLERNDDIRFILKEFPVLGEASFEASRVSMAFSQLMPELHAQFHIDLLALNGEKNGKRAMDLAIKMGANKRDIQTEMEDPQVIEAIQSNHEIATNLGISGTPSYIIGNVVLPGAVGIEELTDQMNEQLQ